MYNSDNMFLMRSLNELTLIPAPISNIKSRSQCNPFIKYPTNRHKLPIFIAPMTCLIDDTNYKRVNEESFFIPILPVSNKYNNGYKLFSNKDYQWQAVTLKSIENITNNTDLIDIDTNTCPNILIDCANGNMKKIFDIVTELKDKYKDNITIMTGNIANPETYEKCILAGVDYVRVGIGGGGGCLTSVNTGIHCSLPWIIRECINVRKRYTNRKHPKIVADGGINTIDKIIKCLALGADYVMIGEMFAKTNESCGITDRCCEGTYKSYYGQASQQGQIDRFGTIKSYPEGVERWIKMEDCSMNQLEEAIIASLQSAMSYCNCLTLDEFIDNRFIIPQTINEYQSYFKE